ncbi:MAG: alpha amylase C-terminal domain-containing protein, partial [Clostridium sp.]
CIDSANNIVVFARKTDKREETLLFVCNFAPVLQEKYKIGVPFAGKYKEIFNSDAKQFGGGGKLNTRVKTSRKEECDRRKDSITMQVPPLGITVLSCTPEAPKKKAAPEAPKKKAAPKTAVKHKAVL